MTDRDVERKTRKPPSIFLTAVLSKISPATIKTNLEDLAEFWVNETGSLKKKAYHLIWSISPVLQKKALQCRIPIEELLFFSALSSLNDYTAWMHPETSLGFVLGFHSDKPNRHLHGLIFPSADDGTALNFSRMAVFNLGSKPIRVDCQGFLHRAFIESLDDIDRTIKNGIPRESLLPGPALARAFLGNIIHVGMAEKLAKEGNISNEAAATKTLPEAYEAMASPEAMEAAKKDGRESYRSFAHAMNSPEIHDAAVTGILRSMRNLTAENIERRLRLRAEMDRLVAVHDKLQKSPDRIPDIYFCKGGPRLEPGNQIEPIQHLLGVVKSEDAIHDPAALAVLHDARRVRVQKAHSDVVTGMTNFCQALEKEAGYSPNHSVKFMYFARSLVDLIAVKDGVVPEYLTAPIAKQPNNDFLEKPDHGSAYLRALMIADAERRLRRTPLFKLETDADIELGPAASGISGDEVEDEVLELKPPNPEAGMPLSIDLDPTQPPSSSLESETDKFFRPYQSLLDESKRRWENAPKLF